MIAQLCNSHGFPHAWAPTKYHHEVFREITKQVEKLYIGECIIVDGTWLKDIATHEALETMYPNVTRENIEHIFYVDLIDPPAELWGGNYKQIFTQLTTAKNPHNIPEKSKFSFWGYFAVNEYAAYKNIDLPWTGDKLFLSYNRKPYGHRLTLIRTLTSAMLMCKGIVTMGNDDPIKAITVKENIIIENENVLGNIGIPNDICTLGSHDLWQQAFINVVTETTTNGTFLSEKIWKPIIGKRPFLLLGPPGSLMRLTELGFKTFHKWFDEDYDAEEDQEWAIHIIVDTLEGISQLNHNEQLQMYSEMKEILEYNHHHFFNEFARSNKKLMKTIVRDEM